MSFRTIQRMLVVALLLAALPLAMADRGRGKDEEEKSTRPEKQPKVDERQLESFQKANQEIVTLYAEVQESIDQLVASMAELEEANAKDKRKLEKKVDSARSSANRKRRKLDKLLKKKIEPVEKEYLSTKQKHEELTEKAKEMEEKGKDDKAQKYHQDAAKITGKLQGHKRNLDLLYYYTFFKDEEALAEDEESKDRR